MAGPKPITRDDLPRSATPGRVISKRQRLINESIVESKHLLRALLENPDTDKGWRFEFEGSEEPAFKTTHPTMAAGNESCRRAFRKAMDEIMSPEERAVLEVQYEVDASTLPNGGVLVSGFAANIVRKPGKEVAS